MKVRELDIRSYYAAEDLLKGKITRKVAHNTYLVQRDGYIEMTYHGHTIARFYSDHVTVSSCGYHTPTTKVRLNAVIPYKFGIYQKDFTWYVTDRSHDGPDFRFNDGMVFEYS